MKHSPLLSRRLENLHPYIPGEQPNDKPYIKLNANENPFPPSHKVTQGLSDFVLQNNFCMTIYPTADSEQLRESICDMLNATGGCFANPCKLPEDKKITSDMVFCGNGSDEVLSFVFFAFFSSAIGKVAQKSFSCVPLVVPQHTYSFYPVYASFYDIPLIKVPLLFDWSLDKNKMIEVANENHCPTIFANPNAPTGLSLSVQEAREFLQSLPKDRVCVIDEAYCDFAKTSCLSLIQDFSNLVVVRTFSKSLCFAGMRLGYAVANPKLIQALFVTKNSFNHFPVDALTQKAGCLVCSDYGYYLENAKIIAKQRDEFQDFLKMRGWQVIPSQTNFVFAQSKKTQGKKIYEVLKQKGILIRRFDTPGIENYVRITIGTKEQMTSLMSCIEEENL